MPITITSTIAGFRRAGMAHPKGPIEYSDDHFTREQLALLEAEPRLTITRSKADAAEIESDFDAGRLDETAVDTDLKSLTVDHLKDIAQSAGIAGSASMKKAELIAAIEAKQAERAE